MAKNHSKQVVGPWHNDMEKDQKAFFYRKKFYANDKEFSYFQNMDINALKKLNSIINSQFPDSIYPYSSYKRYIAVIEYLLNAKNQKNFASFDEKIIFLIQAIDPDLSIYFGFLQVGYSPLLDEKEKAEKESALNALIEKVTGAFDPQFLKYEELYYLYFLKKEDIVSFVNSDYSSRFFPMLKTVSSFDNVNDNEYRFISRKADFFRNNCQDPYNINSICYNLSNPNSILEIWHQTYKIIFFILVVDPELDALKIYAEESNIVNIKARMIERFGFYHEDFIKLEELYRKRFFPELRVSEWNL